MSNLKKVFTASASATASASTTSSDSDTITSTASASASSDISYEDALEKATKLANNIAISKLNNTPVYTKNSNILIVMDELIAYHNLPSWLLKKLPGYQAFSKLGIEFTNIHNNRQMCSPSRASFQTSTINTGIQSNIDQPFQNFYVSNLSYDAETIPKSIKGYNSEIVTAYYGKEHLQDELATDNNTVPAFNTNTTGAFRCYGFDTGSIFGDSFYKDGRGFVSDNIYLNSILNNTTNDADYIETDPITNEKTGYVGVLPFLKARLHDDKPFHLQYHLTNPHDTQEFYQNFSQIPLNEQSQFFAPFLKEQTTDVSLNDPYFYNEFFPDAYIKTDNLATNYFEQTFSAYSKSLDSLPFIESYISDYVTSSKVNPINEYYNAMYNAYRLWFSLSSGQSDVKSWKNLINNYYGLVIEADKYVYKIYNFLKNNDMLKNVSVVIMSDHGDLMSAHGLKQKGFPFKECVNVSCIVYSSKIASNLQGSKNNVLGSLLDIAPTIDVLMDSSYKNNKFIGTSLIQEKDGKLIPRTNNLPVMNIFNDVMNGTACFLDPSYNDTFLNFNYNFNMIIDYDEVDGKLYKFGRFFNMAELFRYNFIYNTLIPQLTTKIFSNKNFLNFGVLKNSVVANTLNSLKSFTTETFSSGTFTFDDAYNKIKNNFKSKNNENSLELTLFILIISNYIQYYSNYEFIIPAVYSSWDDIIKFDISGGFIEPFCYNITDDYNEVKNIFYKKNPDGTFSYDSSKEELFSRFNDKLNNLTIKQCMTGPNQRFTFIIPKIVYELIFLCFIKFGTDISKYSLLQLEVLSSSFFTNTNDSRFSTQNSIFKTINSLDD